MIATKSGNYTRKLRAKIPEYMIYEIIDGTPIHYKGYREVLAGKKQFSEIMGSSKLQSLIITHLVILLGGLLKGSDFRLLTSELGIHLDKRNNLAGDIVIFDKGAIPITDMDVHYADVPPKVVIEVDVAADPADMHPNTYLFTKTQKLLDFGAEKVIWITTQSRKVTVATPNANWQTMDWANDVEVVNGITFNIAEYLSEEGYPLA
ncbi:Uma2 family endonuclease [Persicitalea sp.]|uniref:Uma2 family endonuclease n=1 Tax=Persicitalea sp. TaxID=3100273 RepID=UPI00359391B6